MKSMSEIVRNMINESISNRDFNKALKTIDSYLNKFSIYSIPMDQEFMIGTAYTGITLWTSKNDNGAVLLWKSGPSATELDSVAFFSNIHEWIYACQEGTDYDADVFIEVNGSSLTKMLQLVKDVVLMDIPMNAKVIERELVDYKLFESAMPINEETLEQLDNKAKQLRRKLRRTEPDDPAWQEINNQLNEIKRQKALIRANVRPTTTISIENTVSSEDIRIEKEIDGRKDWKQAFEDMESYIQMVIDGFRPLALVSGQPGTGKTFRTTELVKKAGKKLSKGGFKQLGEDWCILKGKQTAASLYQVLFQYKEEGDLIMIDDCDSIFGDRDIINIIKAASDSSEERIVSYGTARPPEIPESLIEIHPEWQQIGVCSQDSKGRWHFPQGFEFKGSLIILTNLKLGRIDTAIRDRAVLCDLYFSSDTMLEIIKEMMPLIKPKKLTKEAKEKAYKFLEEMYNNNEDIDISLRSFETCAGFYVTCKNSDAADRMVKEQMKLKFSRGGSKTY